MTEPSSLDALPLSQTPLWAAQRRFYEGAGPEIFTGGTIPYQVTSNPAIAHAYAQMIAAWVTDVNASQVSVVELGPGSGRLTYLLLSELHRAFPDIAGQPHRLQYVCADISPALLGGIRSHPAHRQWVADGTLRFAHFDAEHPNTLRPFVTDGPSLLGRGGAVVVVANYVLDSLPQDAFYIANGKVWQTLLHVNTPQPGAGGDEPLSRWQLCFEQHPAAVPYYHDTELDNVLAHFVAAHEGPLLFPVGGLRCVRGLHEMADGRPLLILAADKGWTPEGPSTQFPHLEFHGDRCFSMAVNFDALEKFWEARRPAQGRAAPACAVLKREPHRELLTMRAFHSSIGSGECPRLTAAFTEQVERRAPDDWFLWSVRIGRDVSTYSLAEMMAALRLSGHDPAVLNDCFTMMFRVLPSADAHERQQLRDLMRRVVKNYYFLGEDPDIAFEAGSVAYALGAHAEALAFLRQSEELSGARAATLFQQARCLYHLGDKRAALGTLRAALAMGDDFEPFLMMAGVLERPSAREFEQRLVWEVSVEDISEPRSP